MVRTRLLTFALIELLVGTCMLAFPIYGQSISANGEEGVAGEPYPNMPTIPPIGMRTGKYFDIPASAQGPAIDPAKGVSPPKFWQWSLHDYG